MPGYFPSVFIKESQFSDHSPEAFFVYITDVTVFARIGYVEFLHVWCYRILYLRQCDGIGKIGTVRSFESVSGHLPGVTGKTVGQTHFLFKDYRMPAGCIWCKRMHTSVVSQDKGFAGRDYFPFQVISRKKDDSFAQPFFLSVVGIVMNYPGRYVPENGFTSFDFRVGHRFPPFQGRYAQVKYFRPFRYVFYIQCNICNRDSVLSGYIVNIAMAENRRNIFFS